MSNAEQELEAALAATWDRDTLAVYADRLIERGDPRGELIAIDLELEHHGSAELAARRASLLAAWLGEYAPSDPHGAWIADSFRFGFFDNLLLDGTGVEPTHAIATVTCPAARYLRGLTVRGDRDFMARVLTALAAVPQRWLTRLHLHGIAGEPVAQTVVDQLIAATPRLGELAVTGRRVIERFDHPGVSVLRISGRDALPAIYDPANRLTAVATLDFAFNVSTLLDQDAAPVAPIYLPALERLDLARHTVTYEPAWDDDTETWNNDVAGFTAIDILGQLSVRAQITRLRLATLDDDQLVMLEQVLASMPRLVELEVAHGGYLNRERLSRSGLRIVRPPPWSWPRPEQLVDETLVIALPGTTASDGEQVALAPAAAEMERWFEGMAADARYAWTRLWILVDSLGARDWKDDARFTYSEAAPFPCDLLVTALEARELPHELWRELRDELRYRRPFTASTRNEHLAAAQPGEPGPAFTGAVAMIHRRRLRV